MSSVIKARVLSGRYKDQIVRITNVSLDETGKKKAAVFLEDGSRANILVIDLEVLESPPPREKVKRPKISMPFMSGSTGSRSMNQTKSLVKPRSEVKSISPGPEDIRTCDVCGETYDLERRKGMPGKLTECPDCALETESRVEGSMIFSHKTGATIEIKKDGALLHEAPIFDPKNKT